jgi:hypothetical protein
VGVPDIRGHVLGTNNSWMGRGGIHQGGGGSGATREG